MSCAAKVTRCMNFGAFVEIAPGIEGMVHISELSYTRRVHKTEEIVNPGDAVNVVVKAVDTEKKRISLSLRDAEGDPWAEVLERFTVGQHVDGVLEKKEKFGYFIRLAPGITGLLPMGSIRRSSGAAALEKTREGETLSVAVEENQPPAAPDFARSGQLRGRGRLAALHPQQPGLVPRLPGRKAAERDVLAKKIRIAHRRSQGGSVRRRNRFGPVAGAITGYTR